MKIYDLDIQPVGPSSASDRLSFTAQSTCIDGTTVTGRVVISPGELHRLLVKSSKNKSRQSHDGAVTVKLVTVYKREG